MNFSTQKQIIKSSFLCGLTTFLVNALFSLTNDVSLILILSNIFPGFIYSIVLSSGHEELPSRRRLWFIALSGGLFILAAWLATDYHLSFHGQAAFVFASLLGACSLFLLYFMLIRNTLVLWRGLLLSALSGAGSALLPAKAFYKGIFSTDMDFPFDMVIVMSIFLVWQSLFGLVIALSSLPATYIGFSKSGLQNTK